MDDYHKLIADCVTRLSDKLGRRIDYVEIGVCTGNSAFAVLQTGAVRHATLIDDWSNTYCGEVVAKASDVEERLKGFPVEILIGDSKEVLPKTRRAWDVGFIDGDHSDAGCLADLENMFPKIRDGGIMFVDDLRNPGFQTLERVTRNFCQRNSLQMQYHAVHHGLGEISVQHYGSN